MRERLGLQHPLAEPTQIRCQHPIPGRLKPIAPPYHLAQIITGACYHFLASRNRILETYGIDVDTREIRELHSNAVIEILFTGMLAPAEPTSVAPAAKSKS